MRARAWLAGEVQADLRPARAGGLARSIMTMTTQTPRSVSEYDDAAPRAPLAKVDSAMRPLAKPPPLPKTSGDKKKELTAPAAATSCDDPDALAKALDEDDTDAAHGRGLSVSDAAELLRGACWRAALELARAAEH